MRKSLEPNKKTDFDDIRRAIKRDSKDIPKIKKNVKLSESQRMSKYFDVIPHGVWHTSIGELPTVELNVAIGDLLELKNVEIGVRRTVWETINPKKYDYALIGRDILKFLEIVANGKKELLTLNSA